MEEVIGQLTAEQYYKWRFVMEEMIHQETKLKIARMHYSSMEKDLEIAKLRAAIYKAGIKDVEDTCKQKREYYNSVRGEIEKVVGVALDEEIVIDDVTFEIKKVSKV